MDWRAANHGRLCLDRIEELKIKEVYVKENRRIYNYNMGS